jgi:hypothetical protein
MEDPALSVFSEARNEYMKQLTQYLRQSFLNFFLEQLQIARDEMRQTPKKYLWQFQNRLKNIKEWNVDKVQHEITRIQITSNCDFLEELITAVFIAHTKVMTAIRISSRKSKVNITVPKLEHYLFKALCECSDLLWANAFLFRDDISPIEKQKNMRQVESIIIEGMQQAIRCLLPVKSILRDLVTEDEHAEEEVSGEEEMIAKNKNENEEHSEIYSNKKEEATIETNIIEETPKIENAIIPIKSEIPLISMEETRHFENKKNEVPSEVHIIKLPTVESIVEMKPIINEINEIPFAPTEDNCSSSIIESKNLLQNTLQQNHEHLLANANLHEQNAPITTTIPATIISQEPTIFQVDTSKKVQFSEYNMGFKDEDEPDPYFETMDDGLIILDDKEENLNENDFDTL